MTDYEIIFNLPSNKKKLMCIDEQVVPINVELNIIDTFEKLFTPLNALSTNKEREDWFMMLYAFRDGWEAYRRTVAPDTSTLAAARAVIAAFVYPHAPMTPAQREVWETWEKLNDKETETK